MANYAKHFKTRTRATASTPQTQPIPGKAMVANSAGGFSFAVSDWDRLNRFLVLGSEGGTYYISEKKLTVENAKNVLSCIKEDGLRVVKTIVDISDAGRAPKNDPALFALALCSAQGDDATRKAAFEALPKVARIGTHLFQYAQFSASLRGWGSGLRKAVGRWYNSKPVEKLAYQIIKYPERVTEEGSASSRWSHRDLLRVAHPVGKTDAHKKLFDYACRGWKEIPSGVLKGLEIVQGVEQMKVATDKKEVIDLIEKYGLPHEVVPKTFASDPDVWRALLPNTPLHATVRTLGRLTNYGVIAPGSQETKDIIAKLTDAEYVKKSRMHPLSVLLAMKTYASGHGVRGDMTWTPNQKVVDALDDMFYMAFGNIEPTGKDILLALDVSGSMSGPLAGSEQISCAEGTACMAMAIARVEKNYEVMGFAGTFKDLGISPKDRLDTACKKVQDNNFGSTNCALPMEYAMKHKMKLDAFVIMTDSETYGGSSHPTQALNQYRQKFTKDAKMVVVGMNSNEFTIADPSDPLQLDVVGFDTSAPNVISAFIAGGI